MGVSEVTLSRAANGNTSIELMENIANALCVTVSDIVYINKHYTEVTCPPLPQQNNKNSD